MSKETELNPCPFCGERPEVIMRDSPSNIIECRNGKCPARPFVHDVESWERCTLKWNTRPAEGFYRRTAARQVNKIEELEQESTKLREFMMECFNLIENSPEKTEMAFKVLAYAFSEEKEKGEPE